MPRKSKVLLVDEMTSSVDAVTEELMMSIITEVFKESTVIAVAHRLKTEINFGKVIVMIKVALSRSVRRRTFCGRKTAVSRRCGIVADTKQVVIILLVTPILSASSLGRGRVSFHSLC